MDTLKAAVGQVREKIKASDLARVLGVQRQAVYQWDRVPSTHVLRVEEVTGIPRHKLRPDLYPEDRERAAS